MNGRTGRLIGATMVLLTLAAWTERASAVGAERVTGLTVGRHGARVGVPTVVRDGSLYRAWYVVRETATRYAVYHAVSRDGTAFGDTRRCFWGDRAPCRIVGQPAVFKARDGWRMLLTVYHAVKENHSAIVQLSSPDGLVWGGAVVVAAGTRDYRRPAVVEDGRDRVLYYERLDRDPRSTESRYYRMESDGDRWEKERSVLEDKTRVRASDDATLHAWYDRSARRWCLLASEPQGVRGHLLVLRLSDDGKEFKEGRGHEVTFPGQARIARDYDAHTFTDGRGATWVYYGTGGGTLWRASVDLKRLVRDAMR